MSKFLDVLCTPLGHDPRKPLGFRADGRPIYPIAGGSEDSPTLTHSATATTVTRSSSPTASRTTGSATRGT
jgi:hypothetical protein